MPFIRAFELYRIRWNIEVVNRETKQCLGLGTYAGRNLNGQIADAALCYITYTMMALEKRMSDCKRLIFRHAQSPGCFSAGYVD